jgi:hypothetical protein
VLGYESIIVQRILMISIKKRSWLYMTLLVVPSLMHANIDSKTDQNKTTIQINSHITTHNNTNTEQSVSDKQPQHNISVHKQIIHTPSGIVKITLPTVPSPIQAIRLSGNNIGNRAVKFSKRVPPNYIPHRFDHIQKREISINTHIGEVNQGRISAYLRGEYIKIKEVKERLTKAGFTILASVPLNKKKDLISIVFTNPSLIELASKPNRGFIATLRILVDTKNKKINITNPLYLSKGFLQDDFNENKAKSILRSILKNFPHLKNSKDTLKFQLLSHYHYLNGMPHYEDMLEVASGDDILTRIKDNKKIVFKKTLENGSVLVGVKLRRRTRKFPKKIGRENAGMLPYTVLIEDGKAKILDPKYYIALMYPRLQMSEFMTIATIPDAIYRDIKRIFRKKRKK